MTKVRILSPAKLNLYLEVLNKRPDGYHNIRSLFERISLSDELTFRQSDNQRIEIKSDAKDIPKDGRNLVYKAASLLRDSLGIKKGVSIEIKKRIPAGSGLGGGSSNAASALLALKKLWNLKLSQKKLFAYGSHLGSDVAFFLSGASFAVGEGRGEKIKPLAHFKKKFWHIIIVPDFKVSTREIYDELDNLENHKKLAFGQDFQPVSVVGKVPCTFPYHNKRKIGLSARQLSQAVKLPLGNIIYNRLEEATFRRYPKVRELKEALVSRGVRNAAMSGSGGAVFGMVNSRKEGLGLLESFKHCKNIKVFVARTL